MNSYGIDDIESLTFKEGVRRRVQMYLGSSDVEGLWQSLKEIINNSTDEALVGFGDRIEITVNESKQEFSVRDYGRSVPYGIRDNGENVLVSIFSKPHTGGKFDHKSYAQSTGCNGIGSSATCLSSSFFIVQSYRDGIMAEAVFKDGENISYKEEPTKEKTGTYIKFSPAKEVFKDAEGLLTFKRICKEVENISYLNSKIRFVLTNLETNEVKEFYSENGISDFILSKVKNSLMKAPIFCSAKDETDEVEIAFIWTKEQEEFYTFANGGYCNEGGSPITGIKTTLTTTMKRLGKKDFSPELIRKGFLCVVNCKVMNPSYVGQVKSKINNVNLRTLASQALKQGLEEFSNSPDFSSIIEMLVRMEKAEKAAERARTAVLEHNKEMNQIRKNKLEYFRKLHDAEELGEDAVLYVAEGSSAAQALLSGRRTKNEGVMEIKGKMLNTFKAQEDRIMKNEEIKLFLYAIGQNIYDFNKKTLRYGKIAIASDQDADGFAIALLIMVVLQTICPQFLKENRLYRLYSPLYIEHDKSGNPVNWWYTDDDYNKDRDKIKGEIARIKGWGSLTDIDLSTTIFSTKGRLDKIICSEEGLKMLQDLMGPDVIPRKEYVFNNIDFSKYGEII